MASLLERIICAAWLACQPSITHCNLPSLLRIGAHTEVIRDSRAPDPEDTFPSCSDTLFLGAEVCLRRDCSIPSGWHTGSEHGEEPGRWTRRGSGRVLKECELHPGAWGGSEQGPLGHPAGAVCSEPPPAPQRSLNARAESGCSASCSLPPGANLQLSNLRSAAPPDRSCLVLSSQCHRPLSTLAVPRLKRVASTQKVLYKWPKKPIFSVVAVN